MLDLHWAPTTNGIKILLFLEESGLAHRLVPVNLIAGEQFNPEFLKLSPNNKIPVLVDHDPVGSTEPVVIFSLAPSCFISPIRSAVSYPPMCMAV